MIADKLITIISANFRFLLKNLGVTISTLVKKKIIMGNSKKIPLAKTEALSSLI